MERMFGNVGPVEIIIVLIIALVVFGPKRLPELGSSLGRGIREFRGAISGDNRGDDAEEPRHLSSGETAAGSAAGSREASADKSA